MESVLSSDDSCDHDLKSLKNQLIEYGLDEDNLSKEEMMDILKALNYSKTVVQPDQPLQKEEKSAGITPPKMMTRRYLNVIDRRMPWSLIPHTLAPAEKARTLAVYIKLMSINSYRQARQSTNMTAWSPPIQIVEATRLQPHRSTRSGRCVPLYADYDDDSSDFDCVITKSKKRRVLNTDQTDSCIKKGLSLKRKQSKDENIRPVKEPKVIHEIQKSDDENNLKVDIYSLIDD
ncbi:uncharacterized protein LOC126771386 isoform X2 [Nymphalis io]|uniref:uncharacterized protein LOC126771386 isoform X2 n=1 Tax=Inachis io TaxID=171585 RepID=UPI0021676BCA|nr:uncharacterized protein LOC126771386 isoform X2 [Nymphalis io]